MTVGHMDSAELFDGGVKGRGLRATKEISAGEVVFAEPGFSAVVLDRYETGPSTRSVDSRDDLSEDTVREGAFLAFYVDLVLNGIKVLRPDTVVLVPRPVVALAEVA